MKKQLEILLAAYTLLEDVTPLRYDCGTLCSSLCCQNNGKDGETLGMWLLPYEKELFETAGITNYTYSKAEDNTETVYCNGKCDRIYRPFACRIYPFYAHLSERSDGSTKITIKKDPRASISCPIAMKSSYLRPTIEFISCAKAAVRILMKDEKISKDLREMSEFLSEIDEMRRKLLDTE